MTTATVGKRPYESLFIVPPETPQDKIDALIEKIKATLSKEEGTLKGVQVWGRRRLAFPIKHNKDGLYIYVDFEGGRGSVRAIETLFRVTDFVIRHITVNKVEAPVIESRTGSPGAMTESRARRPHNHQPSEQIEDSSPPSEDE